jgi:hypothetical protein
VAGINKVRMQLMNPYYKMAAMIHLSSIKNCSSSHNEMMEESYDEKRSGDNG